MNPQPAQRAVTTMASPMIISKDEPFLTKLIFVVVALVIGFLCFAALMALLHAVFPRTARRCEAAIERWPLQALASGLLVYAIGGTLAWFFLSRGYVPRLLKVEIVPGMLAAGLVVVTALLGLTVAGGSGVVRLVGGRLLDGTTQPVTPLRQVLVGTSATVLASWFPLVGWAVVLPLVLLVSGGALPTAWLRRRHLG